MSNGRHRATTLSRWEQLGWTAATALFLMSTIAGYGTGWWLW